MKCPISAHDLIIDYKDAQLPAGVSEAEMQVAMPVGTPAVTGRKGELEDGTQGRKSASLTGYNTAELWLQCQ